MKNSNKMLIGGVSLVLIAVIIFFIITNKTKEVEENRIIGKVVSEEIWDTNLLLDGSASTNTTLEKELKKEVDFNKISSRVRALCKLGTIEKVIGSISFKVIKRDIDKIRDEQDDKSQFIYAELPGVIYNSCPNTDSTFLSALVRYLQAEDISMLDSDKTEVAQYKKFIENIEFVGDASRSGEMKTNKQYFDQVIYKDNFEAIKASYFSEYMNRSGDTKSFFLTNGVLSLNESNDILESTLSKFEDFLISQGFSNLEDFRTYLLSNKGYKNTDELISDTLNSYEKLLKNAEDLDISLNSELGTIQSTMNFYENNYNTLLETPESKELLKKIGENYLVFSMSNSDYADGLDETWSGKEFFGDTIKGNSIIKIGYIYLIDSINNN